MSYENPQVDHSVNISAGSSLSEFLRLSLWLALAMALLVVIILSASRWLAPYMPMKWEQALAAPLIQAWVGDPACSELAQKRQQWLENLAGQLRPLAGLADSFPLSVHWMNSPEVNAFATLGGHMVITQGLIDSVQSENALAMVMGHELGHLRNRDPIVGLSSGVILSLALASITGQYTGQGGVSGKAASVFSQLQFSRRQEQAADRIGIEVVARHYGQLQDAEGFFAQLDQDSDSRLTRLAVFASTHPGTRGRIEAIQAARAELTASGRKPGKPTPLPEFMQGEEGLEASCESDSD